MAFTGDKYLRDVELVIGGLVITALKIEFDIDKSVSSTPNKATIKVYNLSKDQRQRIKKEEETVELSAGYVHDDGKGLIFAGTIDDVNHTYDNTEIISIISCGDGNLTNRKGYVNKTWKKGTTLIAVLEDIRQDGMPGVDQGDVVGLEAITLPSALTGAEPTKRAMDALGRTWKFYWSVQNGALEVVKGDRYLNEVVRLTPSTGLIGTPSVTDKGITFVALLNPAVRPHRRVNLWSKKLAEDGTDGMYRISAVRFQGDNRDGDFVVEADAEYMEGDNVRDNP